MIETLRLRDGSTLILRRDLVGGGAAAHPIAGRRVDVVPDVVLPDLPGRAVAVCPVAIAGMVAIGQVSGMFAALLGGGLSDTLGSKWVLALGLLGGVVASLIFQFGVPLMVAVLWGLVGAAGSLQTLGGSSYLTRIADPRRWVSWQRCMRSAARWRRAGSPVAGRILDTVGYRAYGLAGLGSLP